MSKNLPSYPCPICNGKMRFCTIKNPIPHAPLRNDATREIEVRDGYICEKCGHEEFAENVEDEEEL